MSCLPIIIKYTLYITLQCYKAIITIYVMKADITLALAYLGNSGLYGSKLFARFYHLRQHKFKRFDSKAKS